MKKFVRKAFIGGNWKSNNTLADSLAIAKWLNELRFNPANVEVVVAPPTLHIPAVSSALANPNVHLAAQTLSAFGFGAYTGEISAKHLADFHVKWTLHGHSERRSLFGEDDAAVAEKTRFALEAGMSVVLCVGEQLEERRAERTMAVVQRQMQAVIARVTDAAAWDRVVVAYEPVWAIGTGQVATPEQAQAVHAQLRAWLAGQLGAEAAGRLRIVYGGSVTEKNCRALIEQGDIDGFLVGGASLKPAFGEIIAQVDAAFTP